MIKDKRNQVPTFVIQGGFMIHQPTGIKLQLNSKDAATMRRVQIALLKKIGQLK